MTPRAWLALVVAWSGCSSLDRTNPFDVATDGAAVTTEGGGSTDAPAGEGTGAAPPGDDTGDPAGSSGGGAEGPLLLDVGSGNDTPGCEKVDFLFVIDDSGSMADEQAHLVAAFPQFIDTIASEVQASDYQIMVVTTDGTFAINTGGGTSTGSVCIDGACTCAPTPDCCDEVCNTGNLTCMGVPCGAIDQADACDFGFGVGRRFSAAGQDCGLGDDPYLVGSDAGIADAFACIASVGTSGNGDEVPMAVMLEAVGDELNGPGGCNAGFVRDDAVLVVVFITDEEEKTSQGTPASWAADLVAAKAGNAQAVVVVGFVGDSGVPGGLAGGPCPPGNDEQGAEDAPKLRSFVQNFGDRGVLGSICADAWDPIFEQAVGIIDTTCDEFEPAG
ncbi:MAG: hypothetical protein K1X88_25215 [Nannocystaceae bacterium]|nr:hypothetical protein [Nannocystaceae bacterium]